jgi:hypothetical protein
MRYRLRHDVDRFPHFVARAGMTGTLVEHDDELVTLRMDDHLPGAEEWDNEVCWYPEDGLTAPAVFDRDAVPV